MTREEVSEAMLPLVADGPPEGRVRDATGTSWSGAAEALTIGVLGLCGCGSPIERDAVRLLADPQAAGLLDGEVYRELLLHLLDDSGLLEHGGSVRYPWRTPLGDRWLVAVHECLRRYGQEEK